MNPTSPIHRAQRSSAAYSSPRGHAAPVSVFRHLATRRCGILVMSEAVFSNVTLLAADDDADILDMLGHIFRRTGYKVLQAFDGRSALNLLASNPAIEVVLLDVLMPGELNGLPL